MTGKLQFNETGSFGLRHPYHTLACCFQVIKEAQILEQQDPFKDAKGRLAQYFLALPQMVSALLFACA